MRKETGRRKPLSKSTLAIIEQMQRKRGVRELEERFLIVCEDGKSAPQYFEALKKHLNLSATYVTVVGSGGRTQPSQVVRAAIDRKKAAAGEDSGTEPFSQVWCVIDGDYGPKIPTARAAAKANDVKLAVTTQCFEYWVLLHHEENDAAAMDCAGHIQVLRKNHIPDYDKGKCDFRDVVRHHDIACARARKLRAGGLARGETPENQNPCSELYELVEAITRSRK